MIRRDWSVEEVTLALGEMHAAPMPTLVKTRLGSTVAVCLYDLVSAVGGMGHVVVFPGADDDSVTGDVAHALERLIARVLEFGGVRRRLVAKVYGGAQVPDLEEASAPAADRTIAFIREFLATRDIPLAAEDIGGIKSRQVHFQTATGRVLVRRTPYESLGVPAPRDGVVALV